jgi:hypothetical protein
MRFLIPILCFIYFLIIALTMAIYDAPWYDSLQTIGLAMLSIMVADIYLRGK